MTSGNRDLHDRDAHLGPSSPNGGVEAIRDSVVSQMKGSRLGTFRLCALAIFILYLLIAGFGPLLDYPTAAGSSRGEGTTSSTGTGASTKGSADKSHSPVNATKAQQPSQRPLTKLQLAYVATCSSTCLGDKDHSARSYSMQLCQSIQYAVNNDSDTTVTTACGSYCRQVTGNNDYNPAYIGYYASLWPHLRQACVANCIAQAQARCRGSAGPSYDSCQSYCIEEIYEIFDDVHLKRPDSWTDATVKEETPSQATVNPSTEEATTAHVLTAGIIGVIIFSMLVAADLFLSMIEVTQWGWSRSSSLLLHPLQVQESKEDIQESDLVNESKKHDDSLISAQGVPSGECFTQQPQPAACQCQGSHDSHNGSSEIHRRAEDRGTSPPAIVSGNSTFFVAVARKVTNSLDSFFFLLKISQEFAYLLTASRTCCLMIIVCQSLLWALRFVPVFWRCLRRSSWCPFALRIEYRSLSSSPAYSNAEVHPSPSIIAQAPVTGVVVPVATAYATSVSMHSSDYAVGHTNADAAGHGDELRSRTIKASATPIIT